MVVEENWWGVGGDGLSGDFGRVAVREELWRACDLCRTGPGWRREERMRRLIVRETGLGVRDDIAERYTSPDVGLILVN